MLPVVPALVVVGLLAFARGLDHRRGPQQVGVFGDAAPTAAVAMT